MVLELSVGFVGYSKMVIMLIFRVFPLKGNRALPFVFTVMTSFIVVTVLHAQPGMTQIEKKIPALQDTLLAAQYFAKGETLSKAAKFDSSSFYYNKAKEIYKTLSEIYRHKGLYEKYVRCYNGVGRNLMLQGDYESSVQFLNRALEIALEKLGETNSEVATIYNNLGIIYWNKGDYNWALETYNQSLSIRLRILGEKHPDVAKNYNNVGIVYWNMGDYDRALEYYLKSLSIWKQTLGEEHSNVASSYNNLGIIYWNKKDYNKALEYYKKSLAIRLRLFGNEYPVLMSTYNNIGLVYQEMGDYDHALHYYEKALMVSREAFGEKHPDVAKSYLHLLEAYEKKRDFANALVCCQRAIISLVSGFENASIYRNPPLEKVSNEPTLLLALKLKAQLLTSLSEQTGRKDLEMGLSTYQVAIELIDKMRTGYNAKGSKLFLGETASEIYGQAIRTSLKLYAINKEKRYKQRAFLFAEKSKAAVLQAGLAEAQARQFAKLPARLLKEEKQLRIDLASYDTQLQKEYLKKAPHDSVKIREYESHLFDLKNQYQQLVADFEKNYPEYYELKYQTGTSTIGKIQTQLEPSTALIAYFVGDEAIYIFTISKDEFDVIPVDKDSGFPEQVDAFYRSVVKAETKKYLAAGSELTRQLVKPVMSKIKDKKKLVIIPHDLLYKIPFEALLTSSPPAGRVDYSRLDYLVNSFAISYHYSSTLYVNSRNEKLRVLADKSRRRNNFIGFAPIFVEDDLAGYTLASKDLAILSPQSADLLRSVVVDGKRFGELKYSEQEVRSIIELFTEKAGDKTSLAYFQADATEDAFKARIKNYRIVHIATHSFINEVRPQISGVVFAQPPDNAAGEDGVLYAGETYNLDLNADLVVLSSCESGLGKLIRGEGMMALTRGFLYSGASNVIFSLWKVPDKHTSDFMVEFYHQMLSGKSYAESLRQAKLKSITDISTARPRSWASFVLIGASLSP